MLWALKSDDPFHPSIISSRAAVPKTSVPRVRTNEADMGRASDESAMNNPEERQLKY